MPKFSESPWIPMLLSTGIILSAFAGITYVLVNKLEPDSAHAKVSHPENAHPTSENAHPTSENAHPTSENAHPTSENTSHLGERASHLGEHKSHLGEHKSHLGERASHLGERASHLGERASHSGGHQPRKGDSALELRRRAWPRALGSVCAVGLERYSPIAN